MMKKMVLLTLSLLLCITTGFINIYAQDTNESLGSPDTNLALHKNGVASSTQDANTPVSEVFDGIIGQNDNRWASLAGKDGSGIDESWIYVDLGSSQEINKVVLNWESRPNAFRLQISDDLENWSNVGDVIENGYFKDPDAASPENKAKNEIELKEAITARYVKVQGIQRRKEKDNNNNTGYSLYEFEVYGPGWSDERYVDDYIKQLTLSSRVSKDFTLPVSDEIYGVHTFWESSSDAIVIDALGSALITRAAQDQAVTLTATITRNEVTCQKAFQVVVASANADEYELYPVPRNIVYTQGELVLDQPIQVVFEEGINEYTKQNYIDVLEQMKLSYTIKDNTDDGIVLLVGIKDGLGQDDAYFQNVAYEESISTAKAEGYVLQISEEKNTIAILGADDKGVKYASYTLLDILEQSEGILHDLTIADAPEIAYRGFIEGFYGEWSHENRKSLMEYGGRYKMNSYLYGPKFDEYHTSKWKEDYPADQLAKLQELVETGKKTGVEFVWAAHIGGHTNLSDEDEKALEKKFDQLYTIGVRQFGVFFDDAATDNTKLITFMNTLQQEYVEKKGDVKPLIFCPQYYNKKNGNETYLKNLRNLNPAIQIMWTGDFVVSEINQSVIDYIVHLIERPVYIWWNWPVNDLGRSGLMHLGPSDALAKDIQQMSGLTSNPMNQAQASKVALYSIADYTWNTADYQSDDSWRSAIQHVITDDEEASAAFEIFAQNCAAAPMSFPATDESVYLQADFKNFEAKYFSGVDYTAEAEIVKARFVEIKKAIRTLRNYQGTNHIASEIEPWMNVVYQIGDAGEYVLEQLNNFHSMNLEDDTSISQAMNIIQEGRNRLNKSNGSKKAAQKVLYPFVENLLNNMEAELYQTLHFDRPFSGYGTAKTDYALAFDGKEYTTATLGKYIQDDYFGINLGKLMDVKNIQISMNEKNGSNMAYYKTGQLEYSQDNQHWVSLGTYDQPQILLTDLHIKARFIRYRATDVWENAITGENISNVSLNEFAVNTSQEYALYTKKEEFKNAITLTKIDNIVSLSSQKEFTLAKGEYLGIEFQSLKNIQMMKLLETDNVTLQTSSNGKEWSQQKANELKNIEAKFIRIINEKSSPICIPNFDFQLQLAGKLEVKASLPASMGNNGDIYSGNANNLCDGNEASTLWLKRGYMQGTSQPIPDGRYIQLELPGITPIYDMQVVYAGDNNNGGHVEVSLDGETWSTVQTFDKPGSLLQKLDFDGIPAKYIRYYINSGEWCQIGEIYVNRSLDEDALVVNGDVMDVAALHDGNVFTSTSVNTQTGSLLYRCINTPYPENFLVLKNADSQVRLEANIYGEWRDIATLDHQYHEIDMTAYGAATAFRLSWDEDANMVFYELHASGQLTEEDTIFFKNLLKSAMDKAEALIASDDFKVLAPNVQAMINVRLNEATAVYNDDKASMEACKRAWLNLADALHYAGFKADKTMLKALIDECEAIDTDKYTEASVKAFKDALAEANTVYADQNALQERIDAAYSVLSTAKDGLTEQPTQIVDKSVLLDLINTAKGKVAEADKYVKNADWEAFVEALAKAEEVYGNENATQEEVNKAAAALSNAYMNIRLIPSEEMLKQLKDFINYTKKINRALYSAKDLKVIDAAAKKAQEMFDKKEFNKDEFDAFAITMGKVMDMINDNKIEKPADKDQNKNDGKQNGVKAPGTADTANGAGYLLFLLTSCGILIPLRKHKNLLKTKI